MKNKLHASVLILFTILLMVACVKKKFDTPPDNTSYDPQLPVTHTISELKEFLLGVKIDSNYVITGTVIMNDKSGNYFRKIVIQDNTAGIAILIDQSNLHNDYPIGRKVYVKLQGLYISEDGRNKQLGYTPDESGALSNIPFLEVDNYIIKASYPNMVVADTLTVAALADVDNMSKYLNKLVAIKDVEFLENEIGHTYAQIASISAATSRTLTDCSSNTILLRTSGYANFGQLPLPQGRGTIVGIYTRYNNTPQLYIRDTSDVYFHNTIRCNGSEYTAPTLITIDSLRKYHNGSTRTLPKFKIRGVVISDMTKGNMSAGTIVLQGNNDDKGIILYYGGNIMYNLGDSLEIDITGATIKEYRGKLEIDNISTSKTIRLGSRRNILPKVVTINEVQANADVYESTLVQINTITWLGNYTTINGDRGNLIFSDATGVMQHYTSSTASFQDYLLPPSPTTSIIGIVEQNNSQIQLRIRNPSDIVP
jgi:hypothetical protein